MTDNTYPRLVHWYYFDARGLFSNNNTKERLTKVYILDEKGEEILKKGKVACLNVSGFSMNTQDPYFRVERKDGFTTRAKRHGNLRRSVQNDYPELENKLTSINSKIMDYGEYVYLHLAFLDTLANPFRQIGKNDEAFLNANFVYKNAFTAEFLETLINYQPRDLFRNVIDTYHKRELPELFAEIKIKYPALYQEVLKTSRWLQEQDPKITYVGRKAKVHSLNPGPVTVEISILDKQTFEWDGHTLTCERQLDNGEDMTQVITPSDNMSVRICDDSVVGEQTELID